MRKFGIIGSSISRNRQYPQFRSYAQAASAGTTSLAVSKPSGVVDGDLLTAIINVNTSGVSVLDDGSWTLLESENIVSTGAEVRIYWKIASSEGTTYYFSIGSSQRCSAIIAAFSGNFAANPSNGTITQFDQEGILDEDVRGSSMSLTNDTAMVIYYGAYDQDFSELWSPPTGWADACSNDASTNTYIGYKTFASAGATGDVLYTISLNLASVKRAWLWSIITQS